MLIKENVKLEEKVKVFYNNFGQRKPIGDSAPSPRMPHYFVMSKFPDITPREVGNFSGLRTWVEYGLKQSKNELGWAYFCLTNTTDRKMVGNCF